MRYFPFAKLFLVQKMGSLFKKSFSNLSFALMGWNIFPRITIYFSYQVCDNNWNKSRNFLHQKPSFSHEKIFSFPLLHVCFLFSKQSRLHFCFPNTVECFFSFFFFSATEEVLIKSRGDIAKTRCRVVIKVLLCCRCDKSHEPHSAATYEGC